MARTRHVNRFQDLDVYQEAWKVSRRIFTLSKVFPKEETYALTSQIRRSARSVGAQLAEAWAKRRYPKDFIKKLTDADAEQMETQHWIREAFACSYLQEAEARSCTEACAAVGRMLAAMTAKVESFCGAYEFKVQEESASYGLPDDFWAEFSGSFEWSESGEV